MQKKDKSWLIFAFILAIFGIVASVLIDRGGAIDATLNRSVASGTLGTFDLFKNLTFHNLVEPAAMILLQIIAILVVSRIFSSLFAKIQQPTVIGEILAGIVLGPSLLGMIFPGAYNFLFSPQSLDNLYIISQIGLILFMFTVGMDLNMSELRDKIKNTFIISQSSILVPFTLGMILAFIIYKDFSPAQSNFTSFALFIGISMSITAFPVLARIVQEKGLSKTHLGTISIGSAAINDVTAWLLLVAVIAIAQTGSFTSSIFTLFFTAIYIVLMLFIVRPFVKKIGDIYQKEELMNKSIFAFFILILIISAYTTQLLGIHALFGAFMAGLIMPPVPKFRKLMVDKIEDLSVSLLLPLFFVYTGLKTEIGLLNTPSLWLLCLVFIVVAVVGKLGGSAIPARAIGESWRDSLSLGVLMNTRGLMELIVLNIGLEMGILPPVVFVMLVIMALVTTFMTTPLLAFIDKILPDKKAEQELLRQQSEGVFKTLIAVGNPASGKNLLQVAKKVLDGVKNSLEVEVLHITAGTDTHPIYSEQFSQESFVEVQAEANILKVPITTEYKVADIIEADIVRKVNGENFDFLLVGGGVSTSQSAILESTKLSHFPWFNKLVNKLTKDNALFYPGTLIRDKTRYFIEHSNCSVGVFVNRDFKGISNLLIVIERETDDFLIRYARRILRNAPEVTIQIIDMERMNGKVTKITEGIKLLENKFGSRVRVSKLTRLHSSHLEKFSLMMISYESWEYLVSKEIQTLKDIPSTLIINKKVSRFHKNKPVLQPAIIDPEKDTEL
ncbi:MAG: cation:proton antiporter [Paludibacteraceae bacterium]